MQFLAVLSNVPPTYKHSTTTGAIIRSHRWLTAMESKSNVALCVCAFTTAYQGELEYCVAYCFLMCRTPTVDVDLIAVHRVDNGWEWKHVFVQIANCICSNCKLYLSKLQTVFVQIANCICPNCKLYLSKLQHVFAGVLNAIECLWCSARSG